MDLGSILMIEPEFAAFIGPSAAIRGRAVSPRRCFAKISTATVSTAPTPRSSSLILDFIGDRGWLKNGIDQK